MKTSTKEYHEIGYFDVVNFVSKFKKVAKTFPFRQVAIPSSFAEQNDPILNRCVIYDNE